MNIVPSSNFVRFDSNGLELVVNTDTGLAYATLSAAARMLEIPKSTTQGVFDKVSTTDAQVLTNGGLQGVRLIDSETLYDIALDRNKALARKMGAAGANLYMLGLAGYKVAIERPNLPTDELGWMELAVAKKKEALAEKKARLALEAQIEADADATTLGKAIVKASNNIRIGDFAKSIGVGQNKYFDELRDDGIIQQTGPLPYQRYLDAKYFVVTQIIAANGRTYPVGLITPKGQVYLAKRHSKYISRETVRDAIECQVSAIV